MQEHSKNHWLTPVFAWLGARCRAIQAALLVVMLAGCTAGWCVSAASLGETSLTDAADVAGAVTAIEGDVSGMQPERPTFPESRLASDFRFRDEAKPEQASVAEMSADMPENIGGVEDAVGRPDLLLWPRTDAGIEFDKRKWFTDWHGAVFMGGGTGDTWHAGLSLCGYVIPDRLSMGITTSVGRYRWGAWRWHDHPYWW